MSTSYRTRVSKIILKYRWWLALAMSLFFIAFEVGEHFIIAQHFLDDPNLVRETLVLGVFSPLITAVILSILTKTESERVRVVRQHNIEHDLARELSKTVSWDELVTTLVTFPQKIAPFSIICLLVYECPCFIGRTWHSLSADFYSKGVSPNTYDGYCLPLIIGEKSIALLRLYLPANTILLPQFNPAQA
jgi:hypothetical protein